MKICIYCDKQKDEKEFTLEHVVPQFLGGAYCPDFLKINHVCRKCNNNLGLFVDADFEKNWIVSNWLQESARRLFNESHSSGIPLICLGEDVFSPPGMSPDEVCESWLGPFGEQIFLIRPRDKRLFWYVGGNPISMKQKESRAYFNFSIRSEINPLITWFTFRDAFEGKRVKKIMCTIISGSNPKSIGFSDPDVLDLSRISFFLEICSRNEMRKAHIPINVNYDIRFMSKLSLGLSFALFGDKILNSHYTKELRKGLWYKDGDPEPNILGQTAFECMKNENDFLNFMSDENSVVLAVIPMNVGIVMNLNIVNQLNWKMLVADNEAITEKGIEAIGDGLVIIMYKTLQNAFCMKPNEFFAHKSGEIPHKQITEINKSTEANAKLFVEKGLYQEEYGSVPHEKN